MDFLTFLLVVVTIVWIYNTISRARKPSKLPPGPNGFPIIGNILDLGSKPHQSLAKLSTKYGPVISLKLGSVTTIVISSSEIAKIVLQKNDLAFSGRPVTCVAKVGKHSMTCLPVDNQWRKLRKVCKEQMFSVPRLDAGQGLRKEKLQKLCAYVNECFEMGRVVDIGEAAFSTSLNLLSATFFSMEFAQFNSNSSQEMRNVMCALSKCNGQPNLSDYFPILEWADPQGICREIKILNDKLNAIFDGIVDERLKSRVRKDDLLETLMELNRSGDDAELSINDIKYLLMDLLVAGTDTTSVTVEWAMAELLRHPHTMFRLRDEIKDMVTTNGHEIQESDILRLPYLQAVVKETFRLHPPAPFLIPHKAETSVEINSFIVPKDAQILVNIWTIGRDSNLWLDAGSFTPERFLNNEIDIRGTDLELIPFGSGRRICPGLPLAYKMVHLMLATFVGKFNWKLEDGEVDMTEKFGVTLHKAVPLKAIPMKL